MTDMVVFSDLNGGMLTGQAIKDEVNAGNIIISDFDEKKVNPNSYNLTLNKELFVYKRPLFGLGALNMHRKNKTSSIIIPETGLRLEPNRLYLGSTNEITATEKYIPGLNGRSSVGRLGMTIHVTAGFGDIGFNGRWTLEITVAEPLVIYPNEEICQIFFFTPFGPTNMQYNGRYQNQMGTVASKFYEPKKETY